MAINFIITVLHDNDFGHILRDALEEGVADYGYHKTLCPTLWKKFLIAYVLGTKLKGHQVRLSTTEAFDWNEIHQVEEYLVQKLRVSFEAKAPTEDHDRGSAYIDLHTGGAWTY